MAHYGQLRDYRLPDEVEDIRGTHLYGEDDEKLGTIKDVVFDHTTGEIEYAVVDAGEFDQTMLFLVPAAEIRGSEKHPDGFFIDASESKIKTLPRYDEEVLGSNPAWSDYHKSYKEAWASGPILHKEHSTHTITPEPSEMPAGTGSGVDDQAYMPDRLAGVFTSTSPDPGKLRMRPSGLAARAEDSRLPGTFEPTEKPTLAEEEAEDRAARDPVQEQRDHLTDPEEVYVAERDRNARWAAFENHLRRNRVDITASCHSCGTARDKVA